MTHSGLLGNGATAENRFGKNIAVIQDIDLLELESIAMIREWLSAAETLLFSTVEKSGQILRSKKVQALTRANNRLGGGADEPQTFNPVIPYSS